MLRKTKSKPRSQIELKLNTNKKLIMKTESKKLIKLWQK